MNIFSHRLAPIQINYLGYPGSLGSKSYDYIIGDKIVIPKENQSYFSEKILHMPDCFIHQSKIISNLPQKIYRY